MTSELVDLTGYLNIKKPLLTWLRIFSQDDDNKDLNNLDDGVFLYKVWREINDQKEDTGTRENEKLDSSALNNDASENASDNQINQIDKPKNKLDRIKNLNNLIKDLKEFYEKSLGQLLVLKLPDIFRIAYSNDNDTDKHDLNTLILLLLGSAVQCDRKEYFIEKIKQLDLDDQHELVECIQQITDNPISVWSNEWSDLSLLPQNEHEKMFNLLFLHVQSLIQERDQLLNRLVSIVLKIRNLSKCDCSVLTKNEEFDEMLSFLKASSFISTQQFEQTDQNDQSHYSIINNNINLTSLTINQSYSSPSKTASFKLDTLNNLNSNKNCPNCRTLLNDSKSDKKTDADDASLQSLQSLPSLTKEDESDRNLKLKQTIEELKESKQKLRTVQAELEEKSEMLAELKELLEQSKDTCVRLREENLELAQEARSVKAYRDEIDILNEKVRSFHHLENELQKYKLKMNDLDFYKARVDELRDENRLLNDSKQMLEEQLELSRKKSENLNEVENQLYQLKAYSSELKTQRELDKDKIQNLIEQIAELQVEKKSTIEELSVCQSELKHLRSQLNNSQIYLNDYNSKINQGVTTNNNSEKLNNNMPNGDSCSEENSLDLIINTNIENEKNLRSSLLEQLNSDASKRVLKLELENQKLKFIIDNLRTGNNNELNNNERRKHSSISSLGSVHSDESKDDNGSKSNQLNDRLSERCSSNSSTDSIKSTSLSVFSNVTNNTNSNLNQLSTNQFSPSSSSPLDNNEYDSGCVSLICENNANHNTNKSNTITPVNMLRMQQQQQQLDKERLEEQKEVGEISNCNSKSRAVNQLNNQTTKTITTCKSNNSTIKERQIGNELNGQLNDHLNNFNDLNSLNLVNNKTNCDLKAKNLSHQQLSLDEHQLTKLRLFNGSNSSLSSNASSNIGLKQQLTRRQTDLNKLNNSNNSITLTPISTAKHRIQSTDQIKQIDVKRMPLISTSEIESELEAESFSSPVNYTALQLKDNLKIKSPKYQVTSNQLNSPPKLPPRNPISSTSSSCSSSNSPLTVPSNKQLLNGKLILNKNDTLQTNVKSNIENKIAFNFMTEASCTVKNSLMNSSSNTCTIKQTTSTYNGPTSITHINSPSGFSSSIVTTTTTTLNNNLHKINNEQSRDFKNLNKVNALANDAYRNSNLASNSNFVRGVFRSCNFGSNFKNQKFLTNTTKSPVANSTLNSSLNSTGLTRLNSNRLTNGGEIDPFNRAETLSCKNSKLINKAIQQNGYILKQVTNSSQQTKNDHKLNDTSNFNYLTNSVSSPSLNSSSESDDDDFEETHLQRLNNGLTNKTTVKHTTKSPSSKLNSNHFIHSSNSPIKTSMQIYPTDHCPLQRSKTLMLNSNGKPENKANRPKRIEITTTHHQPSNQENRSLVSSPVSTVSTKSVWYEYGCV